MLPRPDIMLGFRIRRLALFVGGLVICFAAAQTIASARVTSRAPSSQDQSSSSHNQQPDSSAPADHADRSNNSDSDQGDGQSDAKSAPDATVKLRIEVTNNLDKPVPSASVYVRFNQAGGFLHHDHLAELDLKTNQDGTVKVPPIPQGKIMIQIIATGWHTYGKWYDINKSEDVIQIKLDPPPHWY